MSDPILQYLKSIDDRTVRMEKRLDGALEKHDDRIKSLEETRTGQRGIMVGGGAVVTFFAGVITWVVNSVFSHN